MNIYLPYTRLPSEYQEVEYIESSGTEYINTGYIPNQNTKMNCKLSGWDTSVGQHESIGGARLQWGGSGRGFCFEYNNQGPTYNFMFGGIYGGISGFTYVDGNSHTLEFSQSGFYQDGVLKQTPTTVTFTSPVNMCVFATNTNGTIENYSGYKLHYLQLYDNGTLTRDFVPCYRKSDSVIGMYDLVNDTFYTNSGTGTFSKGSDVTMTMLKNAYIGEVVEYDIDFRNNSKSNIQSAGWTFVNVTGTPSLSFSSDGLKLSASGTQLQINRTIDTSSFSKLILTGTGALANNSTNWDGGLTLVVGQKNSSGYIEAGGGTGVALAITRNVGSNASAHRGLGLGYDGSWHRTGIQQNAGEYTWELTIDLNTGAMTGTSSDGQSMSGTMSPTWLGYVKSSATTIGINFDGWNQTAHTINIQCS